MFKEKKLFKKVSKLNKSIVFPEAAFSLRVQQAVKIIADKKIARPILIGDESAIILADKKLAKFHIINPKTFEHTKALAKALYAQRKDKGLSLQEAEKLILDPYYFSTMLVQEGYADGMVGGAECSTANTIRPALQIIKAEKKNGIISSYFLAYGKNKFLNGKTLLLSDCGVITNPTSEELAQIGQETLLSYKQLGLEQEQMPKLAFLSYSSKDSGKGESVDKVKKAFAKFKKDSTVKKLGFKFACDGELQFDAAMVRSVASAKCPESEVQGDANILIFPDLNSGNITYKAMQYVGGLKMVGPILQGLKKPVNDLSRGCTVDDIVLVCAITALQSKNVK